MYKAVSGRGTPVLRTTTFLTWEEKAYSWLRFVNLSPGEHTVYWQWFEPSGELYAESDELSLQAGSPGYTVWGNTTLTTRSEPSYSSMVEPSRNQPEDRTGDWQVKVYFDGDVVLTESFKVIKAPWSPVAKMSVAPGGHRVGVDPDRDLIYVTNDSGEPPPMTFGTRTVNRPYRVYIFEGERAGLLRKVSYAYGMKGAAFQCFSPFLPKSITVNPFDRSVYVSACDVFVRGVDGEEFAFVPLGVVGGVTGQLAVNSANGYVYVERFESGRLTVVGPGPTPAGEVSHLNLLFPTDTGAMAVNPKTNRVYLVGDGVIYVLDSSTSKIVATIRDVFAAPGGTTSIDVNPETNRVYVSRWTLSSEQTTVIDGETNSVLATLDVAGRRVRVNPTTNRVYVMTEPLGEIKVIDGYTNMMFDRVFMPSGVGNYEHQFAVNPATHKLYLTTSGDFVELLNSDEPEWENPGLVYVMSDEPGPRGVVINQVELNPQEDTSGQWVELYNAGTAQVEISGWTITSTRPASGLYGLTAHIPNGTTIPAGGRYRVETLDPGEPSSWLARTRELLTLRDVAGRLVD